MPELKSRRDEAFARLLSIGVSQASAYSQAGWKADTANASRRAKRPDIVARVEELQDEAAAMQGEIPAPELTGPATAQLWQVAQQAMKAKNFSAAATALKTLAEASGELDRQPKEHQTGEDLIAAFDKLMDNPMGRLWVRLNYVATSFETPERSAEDMHLIEYGLEKYLPTEQLRTLGERLIKSAAQLEAQRAPQ